MAKPRPSTFKLRKSRPFNGKEWRVFGYVDGKRKQYWFSTEKEARTDLRDPNAQLAAHGSDLILTNSERADASDALKLLAPFQASLTDAAQWLIPADGFYEWKKTPEGKIPYSIEMKDGSPCVFAGLWDGWQNPNTKEWLRTCVIITGEPNELVAQIHTRMPVILPPEPHEQWLSGESKRNLATVPCQRNDSKTDFQTDQ
jgi:SOS response associated peptidase (SRAP)